MSRDETYNRFGDVWLGDLLHALAHTTVGDEQTSLEWGVELLGLDPGLAVRLRRDRASTTTPREAEPIQPASLPPRATPAPLPADIPDRSVQYDVVRTHSASPSVGGVPDWYENATELDGVDEAQIELRPQFRPLFPPGTTRALLSTALATPTGEGNIDLDVLVELITRQRPITSLPRTRYSSMRLGIQLLIDRGEGMIPYRTDQEMLNQAIHEVAGRDRVETLYFDDSPLRKLNHGDRYGRQFPYTPPTPGTPVVLLSDLGLAGRRSARFGASVTEWLQFAKLVRGAECPLLALTPYGRKRTPRRFRDAMYILPWDRVANVSLVRRTVGHGLELTGTS